MSEHHPLHKAVNVLRAWLLMLAVMMVWNAFVSSAYILSETLRPAPYLLLAVASVVWAWWTWCNRTVIACASLITVGTFLRGVELAMYADDDVPGRLTGISLWIAMAGTTLAFGILNLIAISRRGADEWSHYES